MKRAFSLLELLVVIAILALLAALLFPVFANAKREAYRTTCLSNLHQTGLAIGLYTAESNGLLPVGEILRWQNRDGNGVPFPEDGTRDVLKPLEIYAKGGKAMQCPANERRFVPRWVRDVKDPVGHRLMIPDDTNVLVQCMHHLNKGWEGRPGWERITAVAGRQGNHLVLHADLSLGKEDSQNIRSLDREVRNGEEVWIPRLPQDDFAVEIAIFKSEKWPPEWIQLPEGGGLNWNSWE